MSELREKIKDIIDDAYSDGMVEEHPQNGHKADKILAILPSCDSCSIDEGFKQYEKRFTEIHKFIKDIEWVGECDCKDGREFTGAVPCALKITRPATIEEILELAPEAIRMTLRTMCAHKMNINNGTLRVNKTQ